MKQLFNIDIFGKNIKQDKFEGTIDLKGYAHRVYGEFQVTFDDDGHAAVEVLMVSMNIGTHWIKLNLDHINIDDLTEYIENNGPVSEWYEDYESSYIDYIYDNYKDEGGL